MSLRVNKTELRSRFRHVRQQFPITEPMKAGMSRQLHRVVDRVGGAVWGGYRAVGREADPAPVVAQTNSRVQWAFGRMDGESLRFFVPQSSEAWRPAEGGFAVIEPDPVRSKEVSVGELSGVVVPGLAFDRWGGRLGSGRGFYDRALSGYRGKVVGLAWSCQVSEERLPSEAHDVAVDMIVTESDVIFCRGGEWKE